MSLVGEYEPGSCSPSMQSSSWARRSLLLLLWTRPLLQETFICRWGRGGTRRTLIARNMRVPNGCADTRPTFSPFPTLPGCNCNRFHEVLHYSYVPKTRDTALRHCCHNEGVSTASWPKKAFIRRWWILHGSITPLRQDGRVIIYIEKISIGGKSKWLANYSCCALSIVLFYKCAEDTIMRSHKSRGLGK